MLFSYERFGLILSIVGSQMHENYFGLFLFHFLAIFGKWILTHCNLLLVWELGFRRLMNANNLYCKYLS